jgi:hypothetical protein
MICCVNFASRLSNTENQPSAHSKTPTKQIADYVEVYAFNWGKNYVSNADMPAGAAVAWMVSHVYTYGANERSHADGARARTHTGDGLTACRSTLHRMTQNAHKAVK